ncbi:MAG: hypothetical protein E6G97_18615 [Alphaproteobacteria bacterium]|nr:MAG: hypothetical protein E6G97_18615 [Alphaproteobacteria bacterium]
MRWYAWKWRFLAWAIGSGGGEIADDAGRWRRLFSRLWLRNESRFHACLEWEPRDLWLGLFWRREWQLPDHPLMANHAQALCDFIGPRKAGLTPRLDLWLCLLPCLPIHLTFWGKPERATKIDRPDAVFDAAAELDTEN